VLDPALLSQANYRGRLQRCAKLAICRHAFVAVAVSENRRSVASRAAFSYQGRQPPREAAHVTPPVLSPKLQPPTQASRSRRSKFGAVVGIGVGAPTASV
jgi:hypothetical protein